MSGHVAFPEFLAAPPPGYGQLSIAGKSPELVVAGHASGSAGTWAILADASEMDALKNAGPALTAAVVAYSASGYQAINAESRTGVAISALAHADNNESIHAVHDGNNGTAVLAESQSGRGISASSVSGQAVYGHSKTQAGVVGESDSFDGVFGISHNKNAAGVSGHNPGGMAGFFDGDVVVTGDLILSGADCAEHFDVSPDARIEPGIVLSIREDGSLGVSETAYDRCVAGVISGAGGLRPGILMDRRQPGSHPANAVALSGRVFVKADATAAPIRAGDLLTTSATPGHAMRALNPERAFGAVLGKALRPLDSGTGLIPVLVALQ